MRNRHLALLSALLLSTFVLVAVQPLRGPAPPVDAETSFSLDPIASDVEAFDDVEHDAAASLLGAIVEGSAAVVDEALPDRCAPPPLPPGGADLKLVSIAHGLDRPVQLAHPRDGSGRMFVVQQGGTVLLLCEGSILRVPFLDIAAHVLEGEEEAGLLSVAFDPSAPAEEVFAFFVARSRDIEVVRFAVDPLLHRVVRPGETVIRIPTGPSTHYGGALAFGPDGMLYVSVGDTDDQDNPTRSAQDLRSLHGKILRIDVSQRPYAIPEGNPLSGEEGRPEIWAWGLRNPWRMSFDAGTGDLWIGDVGNSLAEEIDVLPAGVGGVNFGWRVWEGHELRQPDEEAPDATAPVFTYRPTRGFCATMGGLIYRGGAYAELQGAFVFADFCRRELMRLDETPEGWQMSAIADAPMLTVDVSMDDAGGIYLVQRSGTIVRLEPDAPSAEA